MKTREEVLKFGMSFKNVYEEKPFHDPNWQLIRVKEAKRLSSGFMNETDILI